MSYSAAPFEIPHEWEEPEPLSDLLAAVRELRPDANIRKIRYAYYFAEQAHSGQTRRSGEPYITHPLAVAEILVGIRMDDDTLCAALLHDVLEDCPGVTPESVQKIFGEEIRTMVEGVTKLRLKAPNGSSDRQIALAESNQAAESLRKMLMAMAADIRVMVIKLADRLHNMRTIGAMPPDKQLRIASETLSIYAPLAARLGIWEFKWQLEDLSFKVLHPQEFLKIQQLVAKSRSKREEELREATLLLKERLEKGGVKVIELQGRPKHLYSIFNKIVQHEFTFEEILDLVALRIIVEDQNDCYVALGIVSDLWVPIPQYYTDYIARPKPNGYQSLHNKVIGPRGEPLEIQIRTRAMHEVAELGFAAHVAYKEGTTGAPDTRFASLRQQLLEWTNDYRNSSDLLRSLNTDLFSEQVFVFTPKGEVVDLPKDSTPVDFAFRVHTNLGLNLVGAKINGSITSLNTKLSNGDVVEVITRTGASPSLDWMEFVKSPSARSKIRAYFRTRDRDMLVSRGRDALTRELRSQGLDPKVYIGETGMRAVLPHYKDCDEPDDIFARIAEGLISAQGVATRLQGTISQDVKSKANISRSHEGKPVASVGGADNLAVKRAKCCNPVPGEDVVGYVTKGRGIAIHRQVCNQLLAYEQSDPERIFPLHWPADGSVYSVQLKVVTLNRQGLLRDVVNILDDLQSNVVSMKIRTMPNMTAEILMTIEVKDIEHLQQIQTRISQFSDVFSILRTHGQVAAK